MTLVSADPASLTALDGMAALTPAVNAQTGAAYTLALSDAGAIVTLGNALRGARWRRGGAVLIAQQSAWAAVALLVVAADGAWRRTESKT